jgi:deoxyribodipyrimidine photo-lyase
LLCRSYQERSAFPYDGGETEAIERLNNYFWETNHLQHYFDTRNGLVGPPPLPRGQAATQ